MCEFPIRVSLPFRALLDRWVGEALELEGKIVLRGERFSRRVGPIVQ